jgi:hypothetical protein
MCTCIYQLGKRVLPKASYFKIIMKYFHSLFVFWGPQVREATVSVHRTQLAVVRYRSTKLAASTISGTVTKLGQLTREERYPLDLLVTFSLLFSTTGVNQADICTRLIEMMFLVLFLSCKCDTELTSDCVSGVVTPTSGRTNGLNMPPPLKFMTSTTLYYNN